MNPAPLQTDRRNASTVADDSRIVRFDLSLKTILVVLASIAGVWALVHILPALLVLLAALMLMGALNPPVMWLEQKTVRRPFAICLVFGLGAILGVTLLIFTVPPLIAQMKTLVEHEQGFRETLAGYLDRSRLTASLAGEIRHVHYTELFKSSRAMLFTVGTRAVEIVAYAVASVFLAFYMMIDRDRLRGGLFAVVPRSHHIRLSRILIHLGVIVGDYIRGQVLTCALMAGFIFVLLLACGVPNALALAVFGGVMDLLPYIGIFLALAPAVLAALANGPAIAGLVFVAMLAYEEFESRLLVPVVYGRALRLPSSVIFFSLIVGTTLAGIVGALLALPIAAAVLMLVEELRVELPGESIQPEDIAQRREDNRGEREYERRAESMPAEQAAAVAVEISGERKKDEVEAEKAEVEAEKAAEAAKEKDDSPPPA